MTKRIISFFCAMTMCFSAFVLNTASDAVEPGFDAYRSYTPSFGANYGDVNGDGDINARDVIAIMKAALGTRTEDFSAKAADCNFDGDLNARDVIIVMKAALGAPIQTTQDESVVCETRDAYLLVETESYGDAERGIAAPWRLDNRGGAERTSLSGNYGLISDVSTDAGIAMICDLNKTTVGRLDLTTSVFVRGDGFSLEYTNDAGERVYRLYTDGVWRVETPEGDVALTESVDPDHNYRISICVDLDANTASTSIDGGESAETSLLCFGDGANIVDFRFATNDPGTPTATPGAIRIVANYAVNDDFKYFDGAELAKKWIGAPQLKSSELTLARGEAIRSFAPVSGTVVAETQFILPGGEDFALTLGSGDSAALTFSSKGGAFLANGETLCDNLVQNLWYRLKIEADTNAGTAKIYINGRLAGETTLANAVDAVDRLSIANDSNGEIRFDDFKVYEKIAHDDYVPEPKLPEGGEDHIVGINTAATGAEGWSIASAYPDFAPVLGYYDDSLPESADWEIKYLAENGVDFETFIWASPSANAPIKSDADNRLFGGYMNAEYSDMMKYCVVWDTENGQCPTSEQSFIDYYLPYFTENFFKDERYIVIDNMPLVMISSAEQFSRKTGGITAAANIVYDLDDAATDLGFDGVIFIVAASAKNDYSFFDADGCAAYGWGKDGSSVEKTKGLIRLSASETTKLYTVPTVAVGQNSVVLDSREDARSELITVSAFREINEWARDQYIPSSASEKWQKGLVMLSMWNDFGNGSYIMPCEEHVGFGYLDVIRETYTAESADTSLNTVPTAAQKARLCRKYPQERHPLRKQGYLDTTSLDTAYVYVNGTETAMRLMYETSPSGELLIPFDPSIGLDSMLGLFHTWDARRGVLTISSADHELVFTLGSETYVSDGVETPLGFRLYAIDEIAMIPVARLCSALGYSYEIKSGAAYITTTHDEYFSKFNTTPAVFAVGKEYQIMFYQPFDAYSWVEVDGVEYADAVCGNLRSAPGMRRVTVPQSALDGAKKYTVCIQEIEERIPYFTKTYNVVEHEYEFFPVPTDRDARAYMIGDAHGEILRPIKAALAFGGLDFLILNGDIADQCDSEDSFVNAYEIAAALTGGHKPVVYARGNHENRGAAAEILPDYMPNRDGLMYYTFRLGNIWGIVLDCGEDKDDGNDEFGKSTRFHEYRLAETQYIRNVVANAASEYAEEGVERRIAIVHIPYMYRMYNEYRIEDDLYSEWTDLLGQMGVETIMSAHLHYFRCTFPGNQDFLFDPPCPVTVGSERGDGYFGGVGFIFGDNKIDVKFTTSRINTVREETIPGK